MTEDFEESVLANPAFGALLIREFCTAFTAKAASSNDAANLGHILIAVPMLVHRPTVEKTRGMWLDTGLAKAVSDDANIVVGLQHRVMEGASSTLASLAVACASRLVVEATARPFHYRPVITARTFKSPPAPVADAVKAAKRLGSWFALEPLSVTCRLLQVRF
jgi:hypothetical protein